MTLHSKLHKSSSLVSLVGRSFVYAGLVCASSVLAGQAYAETPIDLNISGYYIANISSVDGNANQDKNGVVQDAEIHFTAETLLNNAINLGFYAELNAVGYEDTAVGNSYAYADGAFGRFMIGAINPAATLGAVNAPNFVAGLKMWDNTTTGKLIQNSLSIPNSLNAPKHEITAVHMTTYEKFFSNKEKKVIYFTPRISGMRAGVSFSASNDKGTVVAGTPSSSIGQEDIYSYSLDYTRKLPNDISFALSYGLTTANNGPGKAALIGWTISDPETRDAAFRATYRDVTFAARQTSYDNYGGDTNRDIKTVNYTVSYNLNNATLGFGYTDGQDDGITGFYVPVDYKEWLIGGTTRITDGVAIGYYYQDAQADFSDGVTNDVSILGVTMNFEF